MTDKKLEEKIRILEDIEEIKKLKAKYCYFVDTSQPDKLLELFSENATMDFRPVLPEKLEGKKEISKFFKETEPEMARMRVHQVLNPIIEVEGKKAKGTWYMFGLGTFVTPQGDVPAWMQGKYEDEYIKEGETWKFIKVRWQMNFITPYEEGWVKRPMIGTA